MRWTRVNDDVVTRAQALTIANRFDVVVANQFALVPHVRAMRQAHPGLKILVYLNGTFSRPGQTYAEMLYSHDSSGHRITALSDGGLLMNPALSAWQHIVAADCGARRADTGYDGCYIDVLGLAPLSASYSSSVPIRPATGRAWAPDAWLSKTSALGATVKELNRIHYIMVNGLQNGKRYAEAGAASSVLLNGVDGANAEDFIRVASVPVNDARPEWMWKADVDMLVNAESKGKSVFAMTKVWVSATRAQIDRVHEYALASFLLGTNGASYFTFFSDVDRMNLLELTTSDRFDGVRLGVPTGRYVKRNNVYERSFTNGLVLVNPRPTTTTLTLATALVDIDGTRMRRITLVPNSAKILRKL